MTDLLSPADRRTPASTGKGRTGKGRHRPLTLTALLAGLGAAGCTLLVTISVALAGWFAADAGRYGDTRDAMRVGADAWLLAHGAGLELDAARVTVVPLGVTLLCGYVAYRFGGWAAVRAAAEDLRGILTGAGVLAVVYAVATMVVAVLASHPSAESDLLRALAGGFVLAGIAGGAGVLSGAARNGARLPHLPGWAVPVAAAATTVLMLVLAAAAAVVGAALLLDFGLAANVLSRLHADGAGGLMYTVVGVAFVPNAVLLAGSYLVGPGFALGAGTVVSPTAVVLGPVPAFPLLAALPDDGAVPGWAPWLVAVPVALATLGTLLAGRRRSTPRLDSGAARGLAAGLSAALALALLVTLAGGSAGPGRMAQVGVGFVAVLVAAAPALGAGGLVGGLLAAWSTRRREAESAPGTAAS